jgi:hypothetical protein
VHGVELQAGQVAQAVIVYPVSELQFGIFTY